MTPGEIQEQFVVIDYTNWKGERRERKVIPVLISFGAFPPYHAEPQWVMRAIDLENGAWRHFAMKDIHSWRPA